MSWYNMDILGVSLLAIKSTVLRICLPFVALFMQVLIQFNLTLNYILGLNLRCKVKLLTIIEIDNC